MKSITPTERIVHNYKTAPYKSYIDADGREIPGQSYVQFDDTFPEGAGFTLYRMAPGSSSTTNRETVPSARAASPDSRKARASS